MVLGFPQPSVPDLLFFIISNRDRMLPNVSFLPVSSLLGESTPFLTPPFPCLDGDSSLSSISTHYICFKIVTALTCI